MNTHPPHTTPEPQSPPQPIDLGPLILTTRAQSWWTALLVLPSLLLIVPLCFALFIPSVSIEVKLFIFAPVLIVWIVVFGIGAVGLFTHLDFHLHAVNIRRSSSIVRTIPYADCSSFKFATIKTYVYAVPTPTILMFSLRYRFFRGIHFQRFAGRPTPSHCTFPPMSNLDPARDVIAAGMAKRMLVQLHQGHPVKWTKSLTLLPDAIAYKPLIGRSYTIAYSDMRLRTQGLALFITTTRNNHDEIAVALDESNGWPGFALLIQLVDRAQTPRE